MAGLCLANRMSTECKTYFMVKPSSLVAYKKLFRSQKPEFNCSVCSVNIVHRISLRLGGKTYRTAIKATSVDDEDSSEGLESGYGTCDPLCSVDEMDSVDYEANYKPKTDLLKALSVLGSVAIGAAAINHSWVTDNQNLAMVFVFALGYAGIIFEESLAFNKSGVGLLMAVSLW